MLGRSPPLRNLLAPALLGFPFLHFNNIVNSRVSTRSMSSNPTPPPKPAINVRRSAQVIVATTAMLTFISFWRAAAVVLNDLASSAYYAGGEAEQFIGKTAP